MHHVQRPLALPGELTLLCSVARLPMTTRASSRRTKKMRARVTLTPRPTVSPARSPRLVGDVSIILEAANITSGVVHCQQPLPHSTQLANCLADAVIVNDQPDL